MIDRLKAVLAGLAGPASQNACSRHGDAGIDEHGIDAGRKPARGSNDLPYSRIRLDLDRQTDRHIGAELSRKHAIVASAAARDRQARQAA